MKTIAQLGSLVVLLASLSSFAASAAEVPAGHVLKGGTQYEASLRAAGIPLPGTLVKR